MGGLDRFIARFRPWQLLTAALVVAVGLFAFVAVMTPDRQDFTDEAEACRSLVEQQLRAPASAQFGDEAVTRAADSDVAYISGRVDAENGFGANIRSDYRCEVRGSDVRLVTLDGR